MLLNMDQTKLVNNGNDMSQIVAENLGAVKLRRCFLLNFFVCLSKVAGYLVLDFTTDLLGIWNLPFVI